MFRSQILRRRVSSLVFLLMPWAIFGCAQSSSDSSNPLAFNSSNFAWQRNWKYPVDQLPENMRLATSTLGALSVREGSFRYSVPSHLRPWASWWYPSKEKILFEGSDSPLQKFDRLRTSVLSKPSRTAQVQRDKWKSTSLAWEGLCDSWSLASVYEYEPTGALQIGDTCLTPGDQRALLISAYKAQGGDLKNNFFGQLNRNGSNDIFADLYPDQLHLVILRQLAERKSAFLIDTDPGVQVWTVPVYDAEMTIVKVANSADTVSVKLMLTYPEFQYSEQDRQSFETKAFGLLFVKREYTYNLYGAWVGEDFKVDGGEWTGGSDKNHPDYAIVLPKTSTLLSNPKPEMSGPEVVDYNDLRKLLNQGVPVSQCR